jgi:hypothetical protein
MRHESSAPLAVAAVVVAPVLAECGVGGGQSSAVAARSTIQTQTQTRAASSASSPVTGIPHSKRGDQDADSNGGASDGDGSV